MKLNKPALSALYAANSAVQHLMDADEGGYSETLGKITVDISSVRAFCSCGTENPRQLFREKNIYNRLVSFNNTRHTKPMRLLLAFMIETMNEYSF